MVEQLRAVLNHSKKQVTKAPQELPGATAVTLPVYALELAS
jgi:hypothetical protein